MSSTATSTNSSTPPQMRAWTYTTGGYPSCLRLTTQPAPTLPPSPPNTKGGTHVLIRTTAAALNPVDIQLMNLPLFTPTSLPFPLSYLSNLWPLNALANRVKGVGADFAGEVIAAHEGAGFKVGERVAGLAFVPGASRGTLSEVLLLDVASDVVVRVPEGWTDGQAASLPLVALTARTCVQRCEDFLSSSSSSSPSSSSSSSSSPPNSTNAANNTILVAGGSSATGIYTILLAAARGWRVIATCSARNAAFVRSLGAAAVIDYTSFATPAAFREAVAAHRPAAIVDCVGGTELLGIEGVKRYVTIVGDKTSRAAMGGAATYLWNPAMAARALASEWIPAGWPGARSEKYACVNLETRRDWLEEVVGVVLAHGKGEGEGKGKGVPVVDSVYGFEEVEKAFERLDGGRCRGKVVVEVPGEAAQ